MVKAQNIPAIEQATGLPWDDIVMYLDSLEAKGKTHAELAQIAQDYLRGISSVENPGWWAQGITVAYEQHIGRRKPGQQNDGTYQVSASRVVDEERQQVFKKLQVILDGMPAHQGLEVTNVRTSITPVRSYWKCKLNNMNVLVSVESRGDKASITITQTECPDVVSAARAKQYWKEFLHERVQ